MSQEQSGLPSLSLRPAELPARKATRFKLQPNAPELAAIATELGLLGLKKLRFEGELLPEGKSRDWRLRAHLGASVVQECVVSLAPVSTRIEADVSRLFMAELPELKPDDEGEYEIPEDDNIEALGAVIELGEVMLEALALNLPLYPRAEGVELGEAVYSEPGVEPMRDEDARPFAGLAGLRDKLVGPGGADGSGEES